MEGFALSSFRSTILLWNKSNLGANVRLEAASQQDSFYEIMVTSIEYLGLIYIIFLVNFLYDHANQL